MTVSKKVVEEKPERETIQEIRNTRNPLEIKVNKKWPNMYEIIRSGGGKTPVDLKGMFTSMAVAKSAIKKHLG